MRAAGTREDGQPWRVAVEAPNAGVRQAYAGLHLRDQAVSTSGGYRNFHRTRDGRTVSHTIDPRLGEPVRHSLVSVTVVHPRATLADAYATALLVLGPDGFRLDLGRAPKAVLATRLVELIAQRLPARRPAEASG